MVNAGCRIQNMKAVLQCSAERKSQAIRAAFDMAPKQEESMSDLLSLNCIRKAREKSSKMETQENDLQNQCILS